MIMRTRILIIATVVLLLEFRVRYVKYWLFDGHKQGKQGYFKTFILSLRIFIESDGLKLNARLDENYLFRY